MRLVWSALITASLLAAVGPHLGQAVVDGAPDCEDECPGDAPDGRCPEDCDDCTCCPTSPPPAVLGTVPVLPPAVLAGPLVPVPTPPVPTCEPREIFHVPRPDVA
ncbi:MAG: hypothetical protein HY907_12960 [Deltaproteobacteria bacterium]|nr:hypothetical protein [Deltaproteobacteria bacterium]